MVERVHSEYRCVVKIGSDFQSSGLIGESLLKAPSQMSLCSEHRVSDFRFSGLIGKPLRKAPSQISLCSEHWGTSDFRFLDFMGKSLRKFPLQISNLPRAAEIFFIARSKPYLAARYGITQSPNRRNTGLHNRRMDERLDFAVAGST